MFCIIAKLSGTGSACAVPRELLGKGAHLSVAGLLDQCHARFLSSPETFGYDPAAAYHVAVQVWDRAEENFRSIAFGRSISGQDQISLIPDRYFLGSAGYKQVRAFALGTGCPPWQNRSASIVWRGSVTGRGATDAPAEIPRIKLVQACRAIAGTDAALIGVHETMGNANAIAEIGRFIGAAKLEGAKWPMTRFADYRFTIDIDGHANAWGLLEKLLLGCCVLKVVSPYEQWYYPRLHPWRHYVPIKSDLSDLAEMADWCLSNPAECEWIARNGAALANSITLDSAITHTCFAIMQAASMQKPPRRAGG